MSASPSLDPEPFASACFLPLRLLLPVGFFSFDDLAFLGAEGCFSRLFFFFFFSGAFSSGSSSLSLPPSGSKSGQYPSSCLSSSVSWIVYLMGSLSLRRRNASADLNLNEALDARAQKV